MDPSRVVEAFLAWSIAEAAPVKALAAAHVDFREQHSLRGERWLWQGLLLRGGESYAQPRAPMSLSIVMR